MDANIEYHEVEAEGHRLAARLARLEAREQDADHHRTLAAYHTAEARRARRAEAKT